MIPEPFEFDAARQARAALQALLDASNDAAFALDRSLRYEAFNEAHAASMRELYRAEPAIGATMPLAFSDEGERAGFVDSARRALDGEPIFLESTSSPAAPGHAFDVHFAPRRDGDGRVVGLLVHAHDRTQRRSAEALVRARLELAHYAASHSLDELLQRLLLRCEDATGSVIGFFHFVDPDQRSLQLQSWSKRTLESYCHAEPTDAHYPVTQAGIWADAVRFGRPIVHDDYATEAGRKGLPAGHAPLVRELVVPIVRNGLVVAVLGVGNKPTGYLASDVEAVVKLADVAWDLIESVRARAALSEHQERFVSLFEASLDALVVLTSDGSIEIANAAASTLFGRGGDGLVGRKLADLLDPDDPGTAAWQAALASHGQARAELRLRRPDGAWLWAEVAASRFGHRARPRTSLVLHDVTERRRLELELSHARKLESVGQLAAGIAHEINSPTQYVIDSLTFLREAVGEYRRLVGVLRELALRGRDDASRATIEQALAAAEAEADLAYLEQHADPAFARSEEGLGRVATIVRSMKEFAHPDQREQAEAELERAIETTLTIAKNEYKYTADVVTEFGGVPPVRCHVGDINQVLLNLVVNAAHAIQEKVGQSGARGLIRISTRQDGAWVEIRVRDSGVGIPEAVRARVFDPFFTTKPVGRGTGQGLAIARSIVVEKHLGTISFQTELGKGTEFVVRLPIAGRPT